MEGGFLTTALYPQPSKRSPLGPGVTEPGSNCTEGDQRGESDREVPAWVPLLGKKLGVGCGVEEGSWREQSSCQAPPVKPQAGPRDVPPPGETQEKCQPQRWV